MLDPHDVEKILLSIFIGALIGCEREFRHKPAGLRTNVFICLGSTLFTMMSIKLGAERDITRIAAQIVSGVGFLGAGTILRGSTGGVIGLTTAATIWLVAALGMAVGGGRYDVAVAGMLGTLGILWLFPLAERRFERAYHLRNYETLLPLRDTVDTLRATFEEQGLRVEELRLNKSVGSVLCLWRVRGAVAAHDAVVNKMLSDPDVLELKF